MSLRDREYYCNLMSAIVKLVLKGTQVLGSGQGPYALARLSCNKAMDKLDMPVIK